MNINIDNNNEEKEVGVKISDEKLASFITRELAPLIS